jgi:pilus assembly protein Flp/PilA
VLLSLMTQLQTRLHEVRNERGATAAEYGLLVALIAAVIIVAVTTLGENISEVFSNVADAILP